MRETSKMSDLKSAMSIITSNAKGLYMQIKKLKLSDWIKENKQDPISVYY